MVESTIGNDVFAVAFLVPVAICLATGLGAIVQGRMEQRRECVERLRRLGFCV